MPNIKPPYRIITVGDKRFNVYTEFNLDETYYLAIDYVGNPDNDMNFETYVKLIECRWDGVSNFDQYLHFTSIKTGIKMILDIGCEETRQSVRIFGKLKDGSWYEYYWCTEHPSAFDDRFFVVGHTYMVKFSRDHDHVLVVLTRRNIDCLTFYYFDELLPNTEGRMIERKFYESEYKYMENHGLLKECFKPMMGDKWSDEIDEVNNDEKKEKC